MHELKLQSMLMNTTYTKGHRTKETNYAKLTSKHEAKSTSKSKFWRLQGPSRKKFKPCTTHTCDIYSPVTLLRSFLFMYFLHQPNTPQKVQHMIQLNHAKVVTVCAWQFFDSRKHHNEEVKILYFCTGHLICRFENRT